MNSIDLIQRFGLFLAFVLGFVSGPDQSLIAAKPDLKISYAITIAEPESGDIEVSILVENAPNSRLEFVLPCWAPGRYLRDDFAALISQESAQLEGGEVLKVERPASHVFRVETGGKDAMFRYRAYAGTASIGTNAVEARGALINPAALLPYLREARDHEVEVYLSGPESWRWASSLPARARPGQFVARNWNELAESTILGGSLSEQVIELQDQKLRVLALCAEAEDEKLLREHSRALATAADALLGQFTGSEATLFIHALNAEAQAGFRPGSGFSLVVAPPLLGGHSMSDLAAATAGLFLGRTLVPSLQELGSIEDLPMRDDLWVAPAFLTYLGLHLSYRSGGEDESALLQEIAGRIEAGASEVAAQAMSLAEAAQRMALQRRNDPRRSPDDQADDWIDPVLRGQILGALLDFELRSLSAGESGLVEVLQSIKKTDQEFTLAGLREQLERVGGRRLSTLFDSMFNERRSPAYGQILAAAGFLMETSTETAFLGLELDGDRIMTVRANSAGARAGLQSRDRILRLGGSAVGSGLEERIASMPAGTQTTMTIERRGRFITLPITVDTLARRGWSIRPKSNDDERKVRAGFFGHEVPE